jgi:hypothetical protein
LGHHGGGGREERTCCPNAHDQRDAGHQAGHVVPPPFSLFSTTAAAAVLDERTVDVDDVDDEARVTMKTPWSVKFGLIKTCWKELSGFLVEKQKKKKKGKKKKKETRLFFFININ